MYISPLEEYGLRCALSLASYYDKESLSARTISVREGISVEYVSKVLFLLRKSKIVTATRGVNGGFKLAHSPKKLSLKKIFDALKQKKHAQTGGFCNHYSGNNNECVRIKNCSIRPVWSLLTSSIDSLFNQLTLSDLLGEEAVTQNTINHILQNSVTNYSPERTAQA